jgi:hypothetical protein
MRALYWAIEPQKPQGWGKFSKVSALGHFLCEVTVERTFENARLQAGHASTPVCVCVCVCVCVAQVLKSQYVKPLSTDFSFLRIRA